MQFNRYIPIAVGALFITLAVGLAAFPNPSSISSDTPNKTLVELDRVRAMPIHRTVHFAGVTQAQSRAVLSFTVAGRITARTVAEGTHVEAGQTLARLDDREFRHAMAMAAATETELRTRLAQAVRDQQRVAQLAAHKAATAEELEKVTAAAASLEASLQAAQARLKEAQRLLAESVLTAPYSGTVTALHLEPGEWVSPGKPVIELSGDGPVELRVEVPESIVTHLTVGQAVTVRLPFAGDRSVAGRISAVSRAAMSAGRLFPVKVDLTAMPGLTAGLTAQLVLDLTTDNVLTVPLAAVVNPGASRPSVFVYRNGSVTRQPVQLGRLIDSRIVVQGALNAGDQVVLCGQNQLANGDVVEVRS